MFSAHSQLMGIGLRIAKNLSKPLISKTADINKLACSYFSVKVGVEGEVTGPMQKNVYLRPETLVKRGTNLDVKMQRSSPMYLYSRYNDDSGFALVMRLKALTKSTLRDPCTIQNICNQLLIKDLELNVRECVDILYCLSVLNVHNENLLMKILKIISDLLNEIYKPSPFIISISKSMRNLLIRNTETLNGIVEWFSSRYASVDMSEATDVIQTLAVLNYFPASADVLLQQMLSSDMVEYSSSIKYLNFVWSVALIDRIQPEIAESVMVTSFRKKLESVLAPEVRHAAFLKLINIHAHANIRKFKIKMDSNWYSTQNTWLNHIKDKRRKDAVIRNLIDCLANLLPIRTFNTFVETNSGCIIDAVCFFDPDQRPVTELEFVKKKDGIKLAMLVLSFKDLCSPGKTIPNGIVEFHKRCLTSSDYKVLYIPFNEFPTQDSLRKKTAYLKQKIQAVLPQYGRDG